MLLKGNTGRGDPDEAQGNDQLVVGSRGAYIPTCISLIPNNVR